MKHRLKKILRFCQRTLPVLVCLAFIPAKALAADVKISAVLNDAQIAQGQETVLSVSVAGANRAKVTLPEVEGLQMTYAGQSTQIQFINLTRTDTVTYLYRVSGFKPGTYTIPGISVETDGIVKKSQDLTLIILKGSSPDPVGTPGAAPGEESKIKVEPDQSDQPYFLQMDMKEEKLYVGQVAPATLRLFVRVGYDFSPKSLPTLNSEAFTIGELSPKPEQYQVAINGVAYHMLIWNTAITAIKTGEYTLELKQNGEVIDRDRILGGASSLFDQFMARGRVKPIELKSKPLKVSVLSLPQENKPASFSGAIGSFTFVGQPSSTDVTAGEPMELTVSIEGSGNFARIDWPGMGQNKLWRSYPPTATFKATDVAGVEGKKTYRQALIPLSSEIREIPMQEFTYFDPSIGQYKTLRSDPISLKVTASAESAVGGPGLAAVPAVESGQVDASGFLPNKLVVGSTGQSVSSLTSQTWFFLALLVPGLLLLGGLGYAAFPYVSGYFGTGNKGREMDRALAQDVQAMQSALQQSDSASFVHKARRVLQQVLARQWGCPPESVTRHEVRQRQPAGVSELEALFAGLDAVDYSGAALSEEEMGRIHDGIQAWLQSQGKGGTRG